METDLDNFSDTDLVSIKYHDFNEEREVVGILTSVDDGDYGKQYTIKNKLGKNIVVGTYTALLGKINENDIGKAIKIVFKGKVKSSSGKREYMDFDVYIKKDGLDKG